MGHYTTGRYGEVSFAGKPSVEGFLVHPLLILQRRQRLLTQHPAHFGVESLTAKFRDDSFKVMLPRGFFPQVGIRCVAPRHHNPVSFKRQTPSETLTAFVRVPRLLAETSKMTCHDQRAPLSSNGHLSPPVKFGSGDGNRTRFN